MRFIWYQAKHTMNLYKVGVSGITAAEAHINTTAHNIANMGTAGYNRQSVMVSSAGGQSTANGFIGRGVNVDGVIRQYDSFLFQQLSTAQGKGAELSTQASQLEQLSAIVADRRIGISPALTSFFNSVNAMASSPADPAVRQDLIGRANALATQINDVYDQLQSARDGINTQVSTTVEQVNSYLQRINDLNQQIVTTKGAGAQQPNDLLDLRDQALTELNQLVGVTFSEQNNIVSVSLANGQALIAGNQVYELRAVASAADPMRTVVAVSVPGTTQTQELRDSQVVGGKLGGLAKVRSETLDGMQAQIGQMAVGLALAFNAIHANGDSPSGEKVDFFNVGKPDVLNNSKNTGAATISATFTPLTETVAADGTRSLSTLDLSASDYEISFNNGQYSVRRLNDDSVTTFPPGDAPTIPGLTLNLGGAPADGDKWTIQTTRNAGRDLAVNIKRPEDIASADSAGGASNGQNALALAKLQNQRIFDGGTSSVTEVYSKAVNTIGVQTQSAISASNAQDSLVTQKQAAQQAVSGVNANEEYTNLAMFQSQYQASAKIIDVATSLFDTLLGLRG